MTIISSRLTKERCGKMNKKEFFDKVKIYSAAECNNVIDANGECHVWDEWGTLDGRAVYVKYYLDDDDLLLDNDLIDWDKCFEGAWYYDADDCPRITKDLIQIC